MKSKSVLITRLILGGLFFVFGLNGFFNFLPMPEPSPEGMAFMGALAKTGYFFPLLKSTEIVVGLLLLAGFFVPLALVILAPITVNILAYHVFLDPGGLPMALGILLLHLYLAYCYRHNYASLFTSEVNSSYKQTEVAA